VLINHLCVLIRNMYTLYHWQTNITIGCTATIYTLLCSSKIAREPGVIHNGELQMTLDDFKEKFGTSDHRKNLLSSLDNFSVSMREKYSCYRALAFGSFITEKETPSDIDIMIYVISTPRDKGFNKHIKAQELADNNLDIFTISMVSSFANDTTLPSAAEMKNQFNSLPSHIEKEIKCNSYIEIYL
ncbi:MAG: hypothetical protein Q8S94_08185, partial [Pseudohongiella sp.]|nr:hypothetical protein [Pseudohongiella sp.]